MVPPYCTCMLVVAPGFAVLCPGRECLRAVSLSAVPATLGPPSSCCGVLCCGRSYAVRGWRRVRRVHYAGVLLELC
jgi:hypothetical protein